ncbi:MAG: hypothetical protein ABEL76_15300 [Bradymonadaceae bacterium]
MTVRSGRFLRGWRLTGVLVLLVCLTAGCASTPGPGVRGPYRRESLRRVALLPFYSRSTFGLSSERLSRVLQTASDQTVSWFSDRSVSVLPPSEVRNRLQKRDEWAPFTDGGPLQTALDDFLETPSAPSARRRGARLRWLEHTDALGARYLLFGEVVYHTETRCGAPSERISRPAATEVVRHPRARGRPSPPCLVSHVRLKLVDAQRGRIVWYDSALREWWVPEVTPARRAYNVRRAVQTALGPPDGVGALLD